MQNEDKMPSRYGHARSIKFCEILEIVQSEKTAISELLRHRMNCGAKYEIIQKAIRGEQEKHWQVPWIIMYLTIGKELLSQQITRKSVVIVRFPKRTVFRM